MNLEEFNNLEASEAKSELTRCCGASTWVESMEGFRPFATIEAVYTACAKSESKMADEDWLEAFTHHPRIGDMDKLREKFRATAAWSEGEQGSVSSASDQVLQNLKDLNDRYVEKFGFIFIVCATGKSAEEMLSLLQGRIDNDRSQELRNAAMEQGKITRLRLEKLFS